MCGDTHRPRTHVARGRPRAGKVDKRREIGNVGRAQDRRDAKEVLGTDELFTFNAVTFVKPCSGDDIG